MARYKPVRMPIEAYNNFNRKGKIIEEVLKKYYKNKNVKRTDVLKFYSQKPIYIYDDELINFFVKNKRERRIAKQI